MTTIDLVVTIIGISSSLVFTVFAIRRLLILRHDLKLATTLTKGPDKALEIQLAGNDYYAQRLRVISYVSILATLALAAAFDPGELRWLRITLVVVVLVTMAIEEIYHDRSRARLVEFIRKSKGDRGGE
jgi:hypothetical protein